MRLSDIRPGETAFELCTSPLALHGVGGPAWVSHKCAVRNVQPHQETLPQTRLWPRGHSCQGPLDCEGSVLQQTVFFLANVVQMCPAPVGTFWFGAALTLAGKGIWQVHDFLHIGLFDTVQVLKEAPCNE